MADRGVPLDGRTKELDRVEVASMNTPESLAGSKSERLGWKGRAPLGRLLWRLT